MTITRPSPIVVPSARIMVASDLGDRDAEVLKVALARAGAEGRVALCHVVDEDVDVAPLFGEIHGRLAAELGDRTRLIDVVIRQGDAAEQILDAAAWWKPDMLIVGKPDQPAGALRRIFKPGTFEKVMRGTPCPLLISGHSPGTGRTLVGVESTDDELETILEHVRTEPHAVARRLIVAHCRTAMASVAGLTGEAFPYPPTLDAEIEAQILSRIRGAVRLAGLDARVKILTGPPVDSLLELAKDLAVDELIIGNHGRSGLARLLIGSVSEQIVNEAPCPVLIVPLADRTS
jgi:nucleotide-binding universal stress UspA family protein